MLRRCTQTKNALLDCRWYEAWIARKKKLSSEWGKKRGQKENATKHKKTTNGKLTLKCIKMSDRKETWVCLLRIFFMLMLILCNSTWRYACAHMQIELKCVMAFKAISKWGNGKGTDDMKIETELEIVQRDWKNTRYKIFDKTECSVCVCEKYWFAIWQQHSNKCSGCGNNVNSSCECTMMINGKSILQSLPVGYSFVPL